MKSTQEYFDELFEIIDGWRPSKPEADEVMTLIATIQHENFEHGKKIGYKLPHVKCDCCGVEYPLIDLFQMGLIRCCRGCIAKMKDAEAPQCPK